jgi:hypothetical protein
MASLQYNDASARRFANLPADFKLVMSNRATDLFFHSSYAVIFDIVLRSSRW